MTKIPVYSSLKEKAYQRIKQDILQGKIAAGTPLSDGQLARRMRISRTPVREALHLLQQEGLVEIIPGRGTFVKEISLEEVLEILQIRVVLEPLAVKLATNRINEEILIEMEKECDRFEATLAEGKTPEDIETFGAKLHDTILNACGNKTLTHLLNTLRERIQRAKIFASHYIHVNPTGDYTETFYKGLQEHRAILKALRVRDGEQAASLMEAHLDNGRKALLDRFVHR